MSNNQERLRHGRVTQHASVQREKTRPSRSNNVTFSNARALSSGVHVSPSSSSRRHDSPAASSDAL